MTRKPEFTRRQLLQAAALLTPVAITGCTPAAQSGTTALRAEDPVARSLLYYPNSRQVPADHPLAGNHSPSQTCASCIHVRGNSGDRLRPCPIFPGRLVNAEGWCSIWAAG